MAENRIKRAPQDDSRINISGGRELRYWTSKFQVTSERLKGAVKRVGSSPAAVEKELELRSQLAGSQQSPGRHRARRDRRQRSAAEFHLPRHSFADLGSKAGQAIHGVTHISFMMIREAMDFGAGSRKR